MPRVIVVVNVTQEMFDRLVAGGWDRMEVESEIVREVVEQACLQHPGLERNCRHLYVDADQFSERGGGR